MDGGVTFECPGLFDDSRTGLYPKNSDVAVGNYDFRFVAKVGDGVDYDIRCTSGGASVVLGQHFVEDVPTTLTRMGGVTITVTNSASGPANSMSTVTVSVPP